MRAPIPQILLAHQGKVEFVIQTNPFGGGKKQAAPGKAKESEKLKALRTQFALAKLDAREHHKARHDRHP